MEMITNDDDDMSRFYRWEIEIKIILIKFNYIYIQELY